ncbi:hypothetical protein J2T57_002595 [Natronocella acetinitrilica]|uniref:DUF7210 domain-containing protein n=1 Tax=Natronocella acetinitrilica TaxID=414046 RepID=A0AAE3G449_9GAMM|nr:hypothetical protein [Natronocella acetinitrilica]MCP1675445.1 hypothetical protein [Natronocella acetinitrilica]
MSKQNQALVEVTLKKAGHSHKGKPVAEGGKIKVSPAQRDWMAKRDLIVGAAPKAEG